MDKLASFLPSAKKQILHSEFSECTTEQLKLLEQKGVFPYDFLDDHSKLEHTQLPTKSEFYSKLTEEHLTIANIYSLKLYGMHLI